MRNLIIDCSAGMNAYVVDDEKIFFKQDSKEKKHTDELLLCVDELLNGANLNINEIENICVCVGPGSFTGIRVAISICKGLAVDSNIKVFVLSNFDIYETKSAGNKCLVLDGFSKFVYVRKYVNDLTVDECIDVESLVDFIKKEKLEVFVQNEKVQNLLKTYEIDSKIAQNNTILSFYNIIKENKFIQLNQISPIYLRASQAEIERNLKLSGGK